MGTRLVIRDGVCEMDAIGAMGVLLVLGRQQCCLMCKLKWHLCGQAVCYTGAFSH